MAALKCYAVFFYTGVSGLVITDQTSKALQTVLKKFGFNSSEEYLSSLPGSYSKDSEHTAILQYGKLSNRNEKHIPLTQIRNWSNVVELSGYVWSAKDYQGMCLGDEQGSWCVESPTVKRFKRYSKTQTTEPLRGGVALSKVADDELWFCSDWSDSE